MTGRKPNPETCFQNAILKLQSYWSKQGCVILQPYDMEVGAGTFHPATTLRALERTYGPATRTTTLAGYHDGVEHYITAFQFQGGGGAFGSLTPLLLLHPKLRHGVGRRLGLYPGTARPWPTTRAAPRIWLHGASAGDLIALHPIITELRALAPDATLIASTMTNSGFTIARDRLRPVVDEITYVPYDLPGATRRAMNAIAPDLLVLEYTELWPNLLHTLKRRRVPGSPHTTAPGERGYRRSERRRCIFTQRG